MTSVTTVLSALLLETLLVDCFHLRHIICAQAEWRLVNMHVTRSRDGWGPQLLFCWLCPGYSSRKIIYFPPGHDLTHESPINAIMDTSDIRHQVGQKHCCDIRQIIQDGWRLGTQHSILISQYYLVSAR